MSYTQLAKNVFVTLTESLAPLTPGEPTNRNEGTVTSVNEFITLLAEIINASKDIYNIPDTSVLIPIEQFPRELLWKINHGTEEISDTSKKQLTVVTYTANELPAQVSAHSPYATSGIRNIKAKIIDSYLDPEYDGYSITRVGKDIEATIDLQVWGLEDKGIRDRAKLLRQIIRDNVWFLKHKGLKDIVWLGATENDRVDKQNIIQFKKESYRIVFTELQQIREKNIEQILLVLGPSL
jgi:hypothetical protein